MTDESHLYGEVRAGYLPKCMKEFQQRVSEVPCQFLHFALEMYL